MQKFLNKAKQKCAQEKNMDDADSAKARNVTKVTDIKLQQQSELNIPSSV